MAFYGFLRVYENGFLGFYENGFLKNASIFTIRSRRLLIARPNSVLYFRFLDVKASGFEPKASPSETFLLNPPAWRPERECDIIVTEGEGPQSECDIIVTNGRGITCEGCAARVRRLCRSAIKAFGCQVWLIAAC